MSSNVNGDFDPVANPVEATNDRSVIDQAGYGLGLQLTLLGDLVKLENRFSLEASGDSGRARFTQDSQTAVFTADRGTAGTSDFMQVTDAQTRNRYYGLFFTDTLKLTGA